MSVLILYVRSRYLVFIFERRFSMTEQDLMEANQAFWDFVEQLAEEHEVTADYIIYEFIL
jgi:hypothetical protein